MPAKPKARKAEVMRERRAHPRTPANERASERIRIGAPATLKFGDQEISGFVEMVNVSGMYVATSKTPEIGDYVELVFSLPGDRRSFRVRGNVVFLEQAPPTSAKRPGFGARFERPPVTLLDAIRNLHREH
jgi:Tfp pilus assembly protein PilZ